MTVVVCPDCEAPREVGYQTGWKIRNGLSSGRCRPCVNRKISLDRRGSGTASLHTLDVLRALYEANGGDASGLKSPSTVHAHLQELRRRGLAEKGPSEADGWRPA